MIRADPAHSGLACPLGWLVGLGIIFLFQARSSLTSHMLRMNSAPKEPTQTRDQIESRKLDPIQFTPLVRIAEF